MGGDSRHREGGGKRMPSWHGRQALTDPWCPPVSAGWSKELATSG